MDLNPIGEKKTTNKIVDGEPEAPWKEFHEAHPARGEGITSLPGARVVAVLVGGSNPCSRRLSSSAALTDDFPQSPSNFFMPASSPAAEPSAPFTLFWPMALAEEGRASGDLGANGNGDEAAEKTGMKAW